MYFTSSVNTSLETVMQDKTEYNHLVSILNAL